MIQRTYAGDGCTTVNALTPVLDKDGSSGRARALAAELQLPLISAEKEQKLCLEVLRHEVRLAGRLPGESGQNVKPVCSDLCGLNAFRSPGGRRDVPLYRAVLGRKKAQGRIVLDVTGGVGQDAWLLAVAGCALVVVEREAVVFALLRDGVARAGVRKQAVARRMRLVWGSSEEILAGMVTTPSWLTGPLRHLPRPHVVYMDPFFVSQRKQKGASKRPMQVLRYVARAHCPDQDENILDLALQAARERVVVKRPRISAPMHPARGRMTHSIQGRGCRFDVYHT